MIQKAYRVIRAIQLLLSTSQMGKLWLRGRQGLPQGHSASQ